MGKRILIVEDEPAVARGLVDAFTFRGFAVELATDGADALARARDDGHDLILLDVMLPRVSGFDVLKRLRDGGSRTPVILLTARGEEEDRVRGLADGADDYVVKPFSITELVARVEANLRRREMDLAPADVLEHDGVVVDLARQVVVRDGVEQELPRKETRLLRYLVAHRARVVTREELLEKVWEYPNARGVETRTVDNYVVRLRQKVEPDPAHPRVVLTVRGRGYRYGGDG